MWRPSRSSPWRSSSTSEAGRAAGSLLVAAFLAFAAVVVGCSAYDTLRTPQDAKQDHAVAAQTAAPEPPKRIAFDHKFHLEKGVGCSDCHEGTETAAKAPMPAVEFCMNCHEEIDAKKPKERTIAAFLDKPGGTPQWSSVTAQAPGIVFSHKTHLAKKLECRECHVGIEASKAVSKELFTDMDACTKCHAAKGAKTDCATCHKESAELVAAGKGQYWMPMNHGKTWPSEHGAVARREHPTVRAEQCSLCHGTKDGPVSCAQCHTTRKPADHERVWEALHGQAVRRDPEAARQRCGFCHDAAGFPHESKCVGCHATHPPRDHSQSWRVDAGHGLAASLDRERCEACHRTDSCVACHSSMQPRSHRGSWGAPHDTHCAGCHLPLSADEQGGCGVCHKATPSHQAAPKMPSEPPHRPDLQCRQCHHGPPNLRHFDNGTNCLRCHK
jgi:cytochrome c7-like protein